MCAESEETDPDTERVSVTTYVPAYQREAWREHAEELGMSSSEYVRTMVQAGRRGILEGNGTDRSEEPGEGHERHSTPGGESLKSRVLDLLDEPRDWDALVAGLTDDIEDRLDATLAELQDENRVRYSGRRGGYERVDDDE